MSKRIAERNKAALPAGLMHRVLRVEHKQSSGSPMQTEQRTLMRVERTKEQTTYVVNEFETLGKPAESIDQDTASIHRLAKGNRLWD